MILKCLPTGMFGSNSYILGQNGECAVIDAGVDWRSVGRAAGDSGLSIRYIVLTHAHIDHIYYADEIRRETGAKVLVHKDDSGMLSDPVSNGSAIFGNGRTFAGADCMLTDGTHIEVGGLRLEVIHTPGHTPGGICLRTGMHVFTGDTLFRMSIGRTDLVGGDYNTLIDSIRNRLMMLDDSVEVHPGHGESTTIGYERKHNPFVR